MNKIQILKDEIINKIAAGEVVERPASLVKELIENSIDAGALRITITLEEGGKKAITIVDDGRGISREDLPLAVMRHATSKITSMGDLFNVGTMGFRGEALASIASVSRFVLMSKAEGSQKAYKLSFLDNDPEPQIEEWSHPQGTTLVIKDLFYNVPVRLKFLRSAQTEFSHVLETVQTLALANPHVSFLLSHNGTERFSSGAVSQSQTSSKARGFWGEEILRQKMSSLYDSSICDKLVYLQNSTDYLRIEALISPPGFEKASSKSMFFFVNGRWVKDKVIRYGVLRGYHSHLLKGRYPCVLIFLSLSPELVDVNVHPSKTELRFQYAEEVQGQIARAIRERLRGEDWAESKTILEKPTPDFVRSEKPPFASPSVSRDFNHSFAPSIKREVVFSSPRPKGSVDYSFSSSPESKTQNWIIDSTPPEQLQEEKPQISSWVDWESAEYRGSLFKCYLIFQIEDQALFVDQHAFHERILYEKLCKDQTLLRMRQDLMIPEVLSFEASLVSELVEKQEVLAKAAFTFNAISEEEIEVTSIPSLLTDKDLHKVFLELAESKGLEEPQEFHHLLLATIACHSAVRAGEELTKDKISQLKEQAKDVDFSANCPHGRRVFKWLSKKEIEKWFDRI